MKNTLKRLLVYVKPQMKYLILSLIFAIISVSMMLYIPIVIGKIVDLIIGKGNVDFSLMIPLLIRILIAALIYGATQWSMGIFVNILSTKTTENIRLDSFNKLLYVPVKYIDTLPKGDIIARVVNDIESVSTGLLQGFTQLFSGVVTILATIVFMFTINMSLTIVVLLLTPLSYFVASFISKRLHKIYKLQAKTSGELMGLVEEYIGNQKTVKAFDYTQKAYDKFEKKNNELYKCGVRAQIFSAYVNPSTRFVNGIVYAVIAIIGAVLVVKSNNGEFDNIFVRSAFSVGSLTCFLSYANQYTKPFNEISGVVNELQNAFASIKRVFSLIDEDEVIDQGTEVLKDAKEITLQNVFFSYAKENPLIENLNLDVKFGQRIAIVGPTGCGKTTIINLLMRFYDVNSGSIMMNGNDIRTIKRKSLRENYGMVLQDTWIFKGSVRDNISYGKENATIEEIISAAKAAHCDSFIKRLKYGYDTIIGDDDSISQGQKQLLCIARVMLVSPPILILDEATSSIDTLTEIKVQDAFKKMMNGRTSFIIAHRLSTIKTADKILVMDKGHIIEQGNHNELLKNKGFYYKLYNSQFEE